VADLQRVTAPTLDVLEVLLRALADGAEVHGWEIMKTVKRSGPTVYNVLDRLEDIDWIEGRWDDQTPPGKPRRRYYRLSATGAERARALLAERRPAAQPTTRRRLSPGMCYPVWLRPLGGTQ
jgi:PadR family transcriptional regulator, regulatory protein PadR